MEKSLFTMYLEYLQDQDYTDEKIELMEQLSLLLTNRREEVVVEALTGAYIKHFDIRTFLLGTSEHDRSKGITTVFGEVDGLYMIVASILDNHDWILAEYLETEIFPQDEEDEDIDEELKELLDKQHIQGES